MECQGRTQICGEKENRKACNATDGCEWKQKKSECQAENGGKARGKGWKEGKRVNRA